jgi:hypothetical protein
MRGAVPNGRRRGLTDQARGGALTSIHLAPGVLVVSLRTLFVAASVALALSACSFDQILGKGGAAPAPAAASGTSATVAPVAGSAATRNRAVSAAASAMGAQVVAKPGEYLLCRTVDEYKGLTTSYYTCREDRCIGEEQPATDAKAPKTKSGCLNTCRKLETKGATVRAYCAS